MLLFFVLVGVFGFDIYVILFFDLFLIEEDFCVFFNFFLCCCVVLFEDIDIVGFVCLGDLIFVFEDGDDSDEKFKDKLKKKDKDFKDKKFLEWNVVDLVWEFKKQLLSEFIDKKGILFFGLFNVIDGVVFYEGWVLIMIINKLEIFDEVFICFGWVDF